MTDIALYNNWLGKLAERFQAKFDDILTVHNFEYGDEFEVALSEVLKSIIPRRASVCRGFVVAQDGTLAGDDIIILIQHGSLLFLQLERISREKSKCIRTWEFGTIT